MNFHNPQAKSFVTALIIVLIFSALIVALWFINSTGNMHQAMKLPAAKIAYGVNVDITAMIPGTPYTVRTANGRNFFDLAEQLGINTLRITDFQWESTGEEYSREAWDYVFDEAHRHHLRIVLLLMNSVRPGQTAIQQVYRLLGQYELASAPALWLVDLYNEPDLSDPKLMTMMREEGAYVHKVAPGIPVTIGGWKSELANRPGQFDWQDPADIPKFLGLVDVVSPHLYEFDQGAALGFTPQQWTHRFLSEVRHQARHKLILLEEFGASNGLGSRMQSVAKGSPEWQDFVYRGVLQQVWAEYDQGVIGAVAWIITPRPAWTGDSQGDMSDWAFVLNHGQRLLPAAEEFRNVEQEYQQAAPS